MTTHTTRKEFRTERAIAVADRMNVDVDAEGIAAEAMRRGTHAATDEIELSHIWLRFERPFEIVRERVVTLPDTGRGGE